jgi:hypothetical protein
MGEKIRNIYRMEDIPSQKFIFEWVQATIVHPVGKELALAGLLCSRDLLEVES